MGSEGWTDLEALADRLEGGTMLLFALLDALDRNVFSPEELSRALSGLFDYLSGLVSELRETIGEEDG